MRAIEKRRADAGAMAVVLCIFVIICTIIRIVFDACVDRMGVWASLVVFLGSPTAFFLFLMSRFPPIHTYAYAPNRIQAQAAGVFLVTLIIVFGIVYCIGGAALFIIRLL